MLTISEYVVVYIKRKPWSEKKIKVLRPIYKYEGIGGCKDKIKTEIFKNEENNY